MIAVLVLVLSAPLNFIDGALIEIVVASPAAVAAIQPPAVKLPEATNEEPCREYG